MPSASLCVLCVSTAKLCKADGKDLTWVFIGEMESCLVEDGDLAGISLAKDLVHRHPIPVLNGSIAEGEAYKLRVVKSVDGHNNFVDDDRIELLQTRSGLVLCKCLT